MAPALHAGALRELGERTQQRLAGQPAALLRRPGAVVLSPRVRRGPAHLRPIVPDESSLPIDPTTDVPSGYTSDQRGVTGGFLGDPDIMDTWATSSLTPQIACAWEDPPCPAPRPSR